jgi:hypothetical protein
MKASIAPLYYFTFLFCSIFCYSQESCIQGNCINGQGTYIWDNGDKYVGEWKNNKMNGQGTFTWASGDMYTGKYKDDKMNGNGTYTWDNGDKYVGEFKNDIQEGQGTLIWSNGNKYVGEFKNGFKNGRCVYSKTNGVIWNGEWKTDSKSLYKLVQSKLPKPVSPPNLVVDNILFKEVNGNGNRILDVNENAEITFTIENIGKGIAYQIQIEMIDIAMISGIDYYNSQSFDYCFEILPGKSKNFTIPISGEFQLDSGKANFEILIKEGNGFNIDPFKVSFNTQKFKSPAVTIADYKFTSNEEGKIKLGYPVSLNIVIQNIGQGDASDVNVSFINPINVYPGGKSNFNIDKLRPNESKAITYDFFASKIYSKSSIPIEVNLSESYGKYGEKKIVTVSLEQDLTKTQEISINGQIENLIQINKVSLSSDVDKDIPKGLPLNSKKYALIIGCEDYAKYQTGLDKEVNVDFAANDARVFAEYASTTLGYPKDQIYLLIDPTSSQIKQNLEKLQKAIEIEKGKAEVLFYYSGHGLPDENTKEPYLIPVDVNGNNPQDGISIVDLYSKLSKSPTIKATVVLDACFSGGARNKELVAMKGVKVRAKIDAVPGNLVVFSSSKGTETSAVYKEKQHGYFTYFLLKNLKEYAGAKTLNEMFIDVNYQVSKEVLKIGKTQTPDVMPGKEIGEDWKTLTW